MLRFTYKICSNTFFSQYRHIFRRVVSPGASRSKFVVIPEIADEKNSLNIDNISSLLPYDLFIEVSRIIQNFDTNLAGLTEKLNGYHLNQNYDYNSAISEMYQIFEEMDSYLKFIKLISYNTDDEIMHLIIFRLSNKILSASTQFLGINSLGFIFDELLKKELNGFQRMVVEMMKINFNRFGGYLPKDKMDTMRYNLSVLIRHQMKFNDSVTNSKFNIQQYVDRSDLAHDIPKSLLSQFKVPGMKDCYAVTLKNNLAVNVLLRYCVNPMLRNQVWLSRRQIAGKIMCNFKTSNYKTISEIRNFRTALANNFDYENYASFIFNTKARMAQSLDDVIQLLEEYKSKVMPLAEKEFVTLNEFAIKEKGLKESLMPWDNEYIQRCYALEVLKSPWAKLESDDEQFDLQLIMKRIFHLLHKMFNINFTKNLTNGNEISYTLSNENHEGILLLKINGNRPKKQISAVPLVLAMDDKKMKTSYLQINLNCDNPTLLNCFEVIANFGKILEYQFSQNGIDINPLILSLPPDAANISSSVIIKLFITSKKILEYIFPELGSQKIKELSDAYSYESINTTNNIDCLNALYVAYFDLEMGLSNKDWQHVQMELWQDFFGSSKSKLFYPFQKLDEWPCSATDIFSDDVFGGINKYSLFWSHDVARKFIKQLINAKFYDWNPNDDLNPELLKLFAVFQKTFIEQKTSVQEFSHSLDLK